MRSVFFASLLVLAAAACGTSQNLGSDGTGGSGGGSGSGAGSTGGGSGYNPCAGKSCGDACTICEPGDESCSETAVEKACNADGQCVEAAPDLCPGVTCTFGGNTYQVGDTFTAPDGCNTCECTANGSVSCTEALCAPCGGIAGTPCPTGWFCNYPDMTCGFADEQGVCASIPQACDQNFQPVCGCDGVTYGNECEANAAGQSVTSLGACPDKVCGGLQGGTCDAGEYCKFPDGSCQIDDLAGACEPIPQGCPDNVDPVCGCDGMTYSNACDAAAAQVSIDHAGPC